MKAKRTVFFGLLRLALAVVPCCARPYFSCSAWHQESSLGHLAYLGGFAKGLVEAPRQARLLRPKKFNQ